jgi:hypothetical protein
MEHGTPTNGNSDHLYQIRVPDMVVTLVRELFIMLFFTYFASMVIDALADSFVSNVFDTDLLLWALLIVGALAVLLQPLAGPVEDAKRAARSQYVLVIVVGLIAAAVVWTKTSALGALGMAYALASGVIVAVLSLLLLTDTDHSTP